MIAEVKYARVLVDLPLLHLDRPFDYSVPAEFSNDAVVGARVRVKFSGRKLLGFIVEIVNQVERPERVAPILEVLGPAVVTAEQFRLTREVANRWVGSQADVLTSAVPPRHVRTETDLGKLFPEPPTSRPQTEVASVELWSRYVGGSQLLERLRNDPTSVRAAMLSAPGHSEYEIAADVIQQTEGCVLVLLPDAEAVRRLEQSLITRFDNSNWLVLTSDLSPAIRYRNYLKCLRGETQLVIGTRSAVFAPLPNLKLIIMMDDGDDSFQEQKSPGWHAREVSVLRASLDQSGWLSVGSARSAETQQYVNHNWCVSIEPERTWYRQNSPMVRAVSDAELAKDPLARQARLPALVFETIRSGLVDGPVLLQVPRRGYQLHLVCEQCRQAAKCADCNGPLERSAAGENPSCNWCGKVVNRFSCKWCAGGQLRSYQIGAARTAEEIGRAFPAVPLIRSGKDQIVREIEPSPALVIATPGAEPIVVGGKYAAAAILDADAALARVDLRTDEECLRRWQFVSSLVAAKTGKIAIVGDDGNLVVQAMVRHDPIGLIERILQDRSAAHFPPVYGLAELIYPTGSWSISELQLSEEVSVWGPIAKPDGESRLLLSYPRAKSSEVARELRSVLAKRAADKQIGKFSVRVDPAVIR